MNMKGISMTVNKLTSKGLLDRACAITLGREESSPSLAGMYEAEHSPIRTQLFWIEFEAPSFVSTHLCRHKIGVEHFVQSMRENEDAGRNTIVKHGMLINAQALISMSRKRLCGRAHAATRRVMGKIRTLMECVDAPLAERMLPECIYRNGVCPEFNQCSIGVYAMGKAYGMITRKD